jgi:hypothetical protein
MPIPFSVILLEAPKNAQSHVTYLAFQLPFNFIIFQTTFHCHCMMKWSYEYDIRINYEITETASQLHVQRKRLVATIERVIFSCSCNERAWHWCIKLRIFSPVSPEFPYFHFSIPLVNRVEYVTLANSIINQGAYWFQMFYDTRDSGSVTGRNEFIMQNHYVKKRETLLYNEHQNYTNIHKKIITSLPKYSQILWHYVLCW